MTWYGIFWFMAVGGCFGFCLGWVLGRKEFAYWLVRHPNWLKDEHSDGQEEGP